MQNPLQNTTLNLATFYWKNLDIDGTIVQRYGSIFQPVSISQTMEKDLCASENWLRSMGCTKIFAPLGDSTWNTYRNIIWSTERPLFFRENVCVESPQFWLDNGYQIEEHYVSTHTSHREQIQRCETSSARAQGQGWRIVSIREYPLQQALEQCHDIVNQSFVESPFFTPISREAFVHSYSQILSQLDSRLLLLAVHPDGNIGGFCLAYPDLQNPSYNEVILKTLAVHPMCAGSGVGMYLTSEMHKIAESLGYTGGGIHALMWQNSRSQHMTQGTVIRRYGLFAKQL